MGSHHCEHFENEPSLLITIEKSDEAPFSTYFSSESVGRKRVMSDTSATNRPKAQDGDIPAELSFEEIIKNRTAPPCSLNDFMDYLLYVEHNAEPLQFFLWYWDYVERWSNLPSGQKALSPRWDLEQAGGERSRFIRYSHKRERSRKMSKVIAIMEMDSGRTTPESPLDDPSWSQSPSPSHSRSPSTALSSKDAASARPYDPHPIPIHSQPFHAHLTTLTHHYLHPTNSPRPLPLSPHDRAACLSALQHTTHPSALLPAFLTSEATLRAHSHPAFVRFARRNANTARLEFMRAIGVLLVLVGLAVDVLLILSRVGVYWRVVCLVPWWIGLAVLCAAGRGVCLGLWVTKRGTRQVRAWEVNYGGYGGGVGDEEVGVEVMGQGGKCESWREHKRSDTESTGSSTVSVDPLRKPSLQAFGPANDYSGKPWMGLYRKRGVLRRVFDEMVVVQNKALVMWQDRTVLFALLWGGAGAAALTVVSLFVPSAGLF